MSRTVTPAEFDAEEFRAIQERDRAIARIASLQEQAHVLAGDHKEGSFGAKRWTYTDVLAEAMIEELAGAGDRRCAETVKALADLRQITGLLDGRIEDMERIWRAAPWSRYFPCLNADGHIHASLRGCSTVRWDTDMGWATELSGRTVEEAVHGGEGFEGLGETLCSVCFPEAPVAWCRSRQEVTRAERETAKMAKNAEREAKAAVKNLTREESARLSAAAGERVTTVAAAKALVRQPAETKVELEYYRLQTNAERWGSPDDYASFIRRVEERLEQETATAEAAAVILAAREAAAPGTGQTREESDAAYTRKLRAARREWFR